MPTTPPLKLTIAAPSKPPIHVILRGRMASAVRGFALAEKITPGEATRRLIAAGYQLTTGRPFGSK